MSKSLERLALDVEEKWRADRRHLPEANDEPESDEEPPEPPEPLSRAQLRQLLSKKVKEKK